MECVAAGLACGAVAALPGTILLEMVVRGRTKAGMGKAIAALVFSFVLLTGVLAAVYLYWRVYVLAFGVSAIGVFIVIWTVAAMRTLLMQD